MKKKKQNPELHKKIKEIVDDISGVLVDTVVERLQDDDGVSVDADATGIGVYFYGERVAFVPWHTNGEHLLKSGLELEIDCGCLDEEKDMYQNFATELRSCADLIEKFLASKEIKV